METSKLPQGLVLVTLGYMLLACLAAFIIGNKEFIFYIVVMILLIAIVWGVHRKVQFSSALLWCLSFWGLAHMAGGLVPLPEGWPYHGEQSVLYSLWIIPNYLKYDHVIHAFGFAITTWACWQGLKAAFRAQTEGLKLTPTFGLCVLSAAGGMGFGALNELIEFIATLSIPETNVGGYINTGWDLVANLVGCSIAATILYCKRD